VASGDSLHVLDDNLALGDLLELVQHQAEAYEAP